MKRFRGGLVFKAHRLLHHSTLGLRVTKKKTRVGRPAWPPGSAGTVPEIKFRTVGNVKLGRVGFPLSSQEELGSLSALRKSWAPSQLSGPAWPARSAGMVPERRLFEKY